MKCTLSQKNVDYNAYMEEQTSKNRQEYSDGDYNRRGLVVLNIKMYTTSIIKTVLVLVEE